MKQTAFLLIGSLILAGVIALPSRAGIILKASQPPKAQAIQLTAYLSDTNEALSRALYIHNLLNEMPKLRDTAQTAKNLEQQKGLLKDMLDQMDSCNSQKLGKVFKNPQKTWNKMVSTYAGKRQNAQKEASNKKVDQLTMSLQQRQANENMGWTISRDVLMDVYENPEKWGEVNAGESFPLWKDQISLFEKQWNQFYEALNASYGVPLKGRPAVDEETRHNAQKYNEVLAAHKAYLAQISSGHRSNNPELAKANPPQAPKALPKWQDIVRIDPLTGQATPELPEPWKEMSNNKFKNYDANGEMAEFYDGKTFKPTQKATAGGKSDLELEYEMNLAVDSLEKGVMGSFDTQAKMVQPFADKLTELGIDTQDLDISNRGQYLAVQKQLKDMKKKAIEEAYQYVERLEEQDKNNPTLAAKRTQAQKQRQARLSAEAQTATGNLPSVIQINQMSPSVQQRLVLSALEKDENGLVYLTETNAMNVDQLMREQRSTDKIIAESYQQFNSVLEKQREMQPQMAECHF